MLKCNFSSHAAKPNERHCRMDCRVKPGNDELKNFRGANAPEFCHAIPKKKAVARIEQSEIRERTFGFNAAPGFRSAQPGLRKS
jgi:hypothetical protein